MELEFPGAVILKSSEQSAVANFVSKEIANGAVAIGFFGGRTADMRVKDSSDVDMVVIKDGVRRGGETKRKGIIHVTYIPCDYAKDPRATFANQITTHAEWIWKLKNPDTQTTL